jgi:hypothetical protein
MRSVGRWACVLSIVVGLTACNKTETFSYANEGSLCLRSNPDGTLGAMVVFPTCLSSTCDSVLYSSCAIEVSGTEITLTSRGAFESPVYGSCSADCQLLTAECVSEDKLPPGDYMLVHGEDRGELTLPAGGVALFSEPGGFYDCACRAPLDEYCVGEECPTWDEAVVRAEEEGLLSSGEPFCLAQTARCDGWRSVRLGTGGYISLTEYFDSADELVAADVVGDSKEFCSNTSSTVSYGPDPAGSCITTQDYCR